MEQFLGTKLVRACPAWKHAESGEIFTDVKTLPEHGLLLDGYKVVYEDGYESWSPAQVFEGAYRSIHGFTFGIAIEMLRKGAHVARRGWNGKGIFLELQVPDEYSKMTSPYIFIDTTGLKTNNVHAPKSRVPWLASQTDMLAEDWEVAE